MSSRIEEDQILVRKVLEGDTEAYAKLFTVYKGAIYFLILKMVVNKSDAEDLTYETFDKVFRNLNQYNFKYAFSTWLFRIANNVCIDFFRKKKGSHISIESSSDNTNEYFIGEDAIESTALNPEETMIRDQQSALLHSLVAQLKPKQREIIEMRYFEDYAYEEIAVKLNIPMGTVKTLLHRAKSALGILLAKKMLEDGNEQ